MKCYNITITGKVQDISFRSVVEYAGRLLALSGFVFNAKDGSVKIICCGEESVITKFFEEIKAEGEHRGAVIKDIYRREIPFEIDLPDVFSKVTTDEDVDIGRKLDKGNELLTSIKADISYLPDIKKDASAIKTGIDNLNTKFDSYITEQRAFNKEMRIHNNRLEKILEKLSEGRT